MSRYPSDVELKAIETWDGTPRELIEFIDNIWSYNSGDWTIRNGRDGVRGTKVYRIQPSTWGWSGNEEIISVLHDTWFWFMFWSKSERGGHYEFEISPDFIDRKSPNGYGNVITKKEGES